MLHSPVEKASWLADKACNETKLTKQDGAL